MENETPLEVVANALEFALKYHLKGLRKGTKIPYLSHLLNVCKIIAERDGDDHLIAAALLHDSVEDTDAKIEDIERVFGKEIAKLVEGATEILKINKIKNIEEETWRERKTHTIDFVNNGASSEQLVIILADKLDNIRSINEDLKRLGPVIWGRFNKGVEDQSWYYKSLLTGFKKREHYLDKRFVNLVNLFEIQINEVFSN